MHLAISISLLVTFSGCIFHASVNAESCTLNTDCTSTACGNGYHIVCQHQNTGVTTNGGLCTCAVDNLSCSSKEDCVNLNLDSFKCISDGHKHCYDNKCICTRW